ncbi:MAG: hypothetical protein IJZ42_13090 [Lachnospiraceae bacterium]|nr:hypothetical protein [Lachnospiraceae bacterium]
MDNSINSFAITGSDEAIIAVIKSSIKLSNEVIAHYDFVINDISSTISNPILEANKGPSIAFLKDMREQWINFRKQLRSDLESLERKRNE